jgi:hypothetical protein
VIGVSVFKDRGLTLTQKDPRELLNGEARFRKRDGKRKGKDFYYELVVKCDDVCSVSAVDWKDFNNEVAKGLGTLMITKLIDDALANIQQHAKWVKAYHNLQEMLKPYRGQGRTVTIPEELHAAAATLWQPGQPVMYDDRECVVIGVESPYVNIKRRHVSDGENNTTLPVKAALLKAVDIVEKSKRGVDA